MELRCSLASESERNVHLEASLSSVRQGFRKRGKPLRRRSSSLLSLKARLAST